MVQVQVSDIFHKNPNRPTIFFSFIGTQALVRAGSNHSSISAEEGDPSPTDLQIIGRARALVDYTPSPYDKEALKFKVFATISEIIRPLSL